MANQTSNGRACTCVVTEYHYRDSDNFTIEVDLLSTEEFAAQSAEMLRVYRIFKHIDDNVGAEEKENLKEKARIAQDFFQTTFRGRLTEEEFLLSEPIDDVLRLLGEQAAEMQPSGLGDTHITTSLDECSSILGRLSTGHTTSVLGQDPVTWPLIRKIR